LQGRLAAQEMAATRAQEALARLQEEHSTRSRSIVSRFVSLLFFFFKSHSMSLLFADIRTSTS
jgi:hypothetical protein